MNMNINITVGPGDELRVQRAGEVVSLALGANTEGLRLLAKAAATFRRYEDIHEAITREEKIRTNRNMAEEIESYLEERK